MAVDVEAFTDLASFKKTTGDILRELRASRKMPGHDRIYTAGEKEYLTWQDRKKSGIPLNKSLQKELLKLREECGLKKYKFPF
jgi:LDH2 family malate/lactate/ureidoglycolate dehydrogenase